MTISVDIRHPFPGFELETRFDIGGSGITAIFGPSGSGKSTVINAIAGLLSPRAGRIAFNGETVFNSAEGIFVPSRKRRVGYVFQDARLFPHMNVRRNLDFGARRTKTPHPKAEADRIVEMLAIGHLLDRYPATLSGGERQRVAIGRALLGNPRILLLDEPMAALDQGRKAEIMPYLERIRDEATVPVVYVSHSLDEVTRLADDMVLLNAGKIAATGTVFDITSRLDLFPLTGRFEAGTVIDCAVKEQDGRDHLSLLTFEGGDIWVPEVAARVGERIRMRIRARDIIIALDEPKGLSANNTVAGTISDIRLDEGPFLDVLIDCGGVKLIARITHRSRNRLDLRTGQKVYALIKSVSVDRASPARSSGR